MPTFIFYNFGAFNVMFINLFIESLTAARTCPRPLRPTQTHEVAFGGAGRHQKSTLLKFRHKTAVMFGNVQAKRRCG